MANLLYTNKIDKDIDEKIDINQEQLEFILEKSNKSEDKV